MNMTILGAGSMGTALGIVGIRAGHRVTVWSIEPDVIADVNRQHRNQRYLKDIKLPMTLKATGDLAGALHGASIVILAVPSKVMRIVCTSARPLLPRKAIILNAAKGFEQGSMLRMSEVIMDVLLSCPQGRIATLSGPSIAQEIALGVPTGVVVASSSRQTITRVRMALATSSFTIQPSNDLVGVEAYGTMKNIYAIAIGLCDGMKLSMNAKSLLLTVALSEMRSMVERLGGRPETALSLAGVGDLIVTALSEHGRNRTFGEWICTQRGCHVDRNSHNATTLEGVTAIAITLRIARKYRCSLPLATLVGNVVLRGGDPVAALRGFFKNYRFPAQGTVAGA